MSWWSLLGVLVIWTLAFEANSQRTAHRLIGGHLKIYHEDSNDSELLTPLESGSKPTKKSQKGEDDDRKTLSQQVADGKYGLIQKELFTKPSKRPGVISYESNPEVPKDNINSLGGLTKNDIWLAENHLLVLKGGVYPPHDDKNDNNAHPWPAIDDYKAPKRPVKIPANPKIPPPFPVQLTEDGPLQILGTNTSRTLNGTFSEAGYAIPTIENYEARTVPFFPPGFNPYSANSTPGQSPESIPPNPSGEYPQGAPFPPFQLNGTLPPFFASLPPGAAILPPPNQTEPFDEDDPSIYYPPPYSFYYPKDNVSLVPAGPLVPGIILPPPPNFFAPLENSTQNPIFKQRTTTPLPQIRPTTTAVPPTSVLNEKITTKKPIRILPVHIPAEINNELHPIVTTIPPKIVTILPVRQNIKSRTRPPKVTILKPVKTTSAPPKIYVYDDNEIYKSRIKTVVTTTQIPLKVYYSTTNDIDTNSITRAPAEKFHIGIRTNSRAPKTTTKPPPPPPYYFYEEQTTKKPPYYYLPAKPINQQVPPRSPPPQKLIYVTTRPYNTQRPRYRFVETPKDTFSIHIARLQKQIHQYYTTPRPSKPVYQFSFEASNYRRPPQQSSQDKFRPLPKYSVQIQPALEILPTQTPQYKEVSTERPAQTNYYNTRRPSPDYDYEDHGPEGRKIPSAPIRAINQYSFESTPNPIHQGYYTKPDEGYFDENTKQYFNTFGQKIPIATTPLPRPQKIPHLSLEGDTAVNYLPPRPAINPDAEYIQPNGNYPQVAKYGSRGQYLREQSKKVPIVDGRDGSFISYQLPGDDGAHFYFLTPQLAQSRDQGAGYYFSQPRVRRNKER